MPTRGELMQMVKSIAENVMQSLQTLLTILLNQVATQVSNQEVPQNQASMMSELLSEVQSQKEKIEELAHMMKHSPSPKRTSTEDDLVVLTESDLEVWDQEVRVYQHARTGGKPMIPPARTSAPMSPPQKVKSVAAGKGSFAAPGMSGQMVASLVGITSPGTPSHVHSPGSERGQSSQGPSNSHSLAWTTTAMDQWGQKLVTWGKKHPGKQFAQVYEMQAILDWRVQLIRTSAIGFVAMQKSLPKVNR